MRVNKKILFILVMLLGLVGCSNSKDEDKKILDDNTSPKHASEVSKQGDTKENDCESDGIYYLSDNISIYQGESFSEGIAWILYYEKEDDSNLKRALVKSNGEMIPIDLDIKNEYSLGSCFCGGYSYLNYKIDDKNAFIIFDEDGNRVLESKDDAGYEILCGGDGWYLVQKSIRSMDENMDQYGIIDVSGKWIFEPQSNFIAVNHVWLDLQDPYELRYWYLGNGVFCAHGYVEDNGIEPPLYVVLDVKTGDYNPIELPINTEKSYSILGVYEEGVIYSIEDREGGQIFRLNWDGSYDEVFNRYNGNYLDVKFGDDIIYVGDEEIKEFIDLDGNSLIDISERDLVTDGELCRFSNGYAPVLIEGKDSNYYFEFINKDGECKFEPIKVVYTYLGGFDDNKVACRLNLEQDYVSWIDVDGNIEKSKLDVGKMERLNFSEGYAFDSTDKCYVDFKGEILKLKYTK